MAETKPDAVGRCEQCKRENVELYLIDFGCGGSMFLCEECAGDEI